MMKLFSVLTNYILNKFSTSNQNDAPKSTKSFEARQSSSHGKLYLWGLLNGEFYKSFLFVKSYKSMNDLLWQDGFLIDFLQKKIVDKWLSNFVMYSGNLFSESLLFDNVVSFFMEFMFKPVSYFFMYESNSPIQMMLVNVQLLVLSTITVSLLYMSMVLF